MLILGSTYYSPLIALFSYCRLLIEWHLSRQLLVIPGELIHLSFIVQDIGPSYIYMDTISIIGRIIMKTNSEWVVLVIHYFWIYFPERIIHASSLVRMACNRHFSIWNKGNVYGLKTDIIGDYSFYYYYTPNTCVINKWKNFCFTW